MKDTLTNRYQRIREDLKAHLNRDRYHHSLGVAYTAACLAMRYGADVEKAYLAGLLHDAAKYDSATYLSRAEAAGLAVSKIERESPGLLHGKLGADLAKREYGISDPEILSAIENHTVGHADMTTLEAILYVADYIEPNRQDLAGLQEIRDAAFKDLDLAVYLTADMCLEFLRKKQVPIEPHSVETLECYRKRIENKSGT